MFPSSKVDKYVDNERQEVIIFTNGDKYVRDKKTGRVITQIGVSYVYYCIELIKTINENVFSLLIYNF